MSIIQLIIFCSLGFTFFFYLIKEIKEIRLLKTTLNRIIDKPKIESIQDITKIKNYLQTNITYTGKLKTKKRPFLRDSATQILTTQHGFCGENARVAIKLFYTGGIKARRIYMFRKEWQHVLIEHEFKKKWYMFDGHNDPSTLLEDESVAKIPSESISLYPNDYENNPYLDFCKIKAFYSIKLLKSYAKINLPSILVYFFESPNLIKAIGILILWLLFVLSSI